MWRRRKRGEGEKEETCGGEGKDEQVRRRRHVEEEKVWRRRKREEGEEEVRRR